MTSPSIKNISQADVPAVLLRFLQLNHEKKEEGLESGSIRIRIRLEEGVAKLVVMTPEFNFSHEADPKLVVETRDVEKFIDRIMRAYDRIISQRQHATIVASIEYVNGKPTKLNVEETITIEPIVPSRK